MTRKKNYRGGSRSSYKPNVSDEKLKMDRVKKAELERTNRDAESWILKNELGGGEKRLRFDYSMNVFSFRGDWDKRIKVIKIFLPIIVSKDKCKKFEELVNVAFKIVFKT